MAIFALYIVAGQIYLKRKHAKNEDKRTEDLMIKNAEVQKVLDEKSDYLRHKHYTNCPNCGSVRAENTSVCSFCGASLIIEDDKN